MVQRFFPARVATALLLAFLAVGGVVAAGAVLRTDDQSVAESGGQATSTSTTTTLPPTTTTTTDPKVLVQPQPVVELARAFVLNHRRRTSIDSAWARSPSARASDTTVGASRRSPALVTRCTAITRTKSAALRPPRKRAAPPVGST